MVQPCNEQAPVDLSQTGKATLRERAKHPQNYKEIPHEPSKLRMARRKNLAKYLQDRAGAGGELVT
jgi:hypothetical protein